MRNQKYCNCCEIVQHMRAAHPDCCQILERFPHDERISSCDRQRRDASPLTESTTANVDEALDAIGFLVANNQPTSSNVVSDRAASNLLDEFVREGEPLVIVDPYIFACGSAYAAYARKLWNAGLSKASDVTFIFDEGKIDNTKSAVLNEIKKVASSGFRVLAKSTNVIHDRIWITGKIPKTGKLGKAKVYAKVMGPSFNSLGKKLGFTLDLPPEDLEELVDYLWRNGLLATT